MTGSRLKQLRDALTEAFDTQELIELLKFRLDKDLAALVAVGARRTTVVFDLLMLAEREGWLGALIFAACEDRPRAAKIRAFLNEPEVAAVLRGRVAGRQAVDGAELRDALGRLAVDREQLQYIWLRDEGAIRRVAATGCRMTSDFYTVRRHARVLSVDETVALGEFAGDFVNAVWRFDGPPAKALIGQLLSTARCCARRVWRERRAEGHSILAKVCNNHLDTSVWCRPDAILDLEGVGTNLDPFVRAERHAHHAGQCDPSRYGMDGYDTVDHLLSQAYVFSLGPDWQWGRAEWMLFEAERRLQGRRKELLAYVEAFRSTIAKRRGNRRRAVGHLRLAAHLFEERLGTSRHHIVACCRMRLRNLREKHARSLGEDLRVLRESAIKYSDLDDLQVRRERVRE